MLDHYLHSLLRFSQGQRNQWSSHFRTKRKRALFGCSILLRTLCSKWSQSMLGFSLNLLNTLHHSPAWFPCTNCKGRSCSPSNTDFSLSSKWDTYWSSWHRDPLCRSILSQYSHCTVPKHHIQSLCRNQFSCSTHPRSQNEWPLAPSTSHKCIFH